MLRSGHFTYKNILVYLIFVLLLNTPVYAQQIITDGFTNTQLEINGNTTNVYSSTLKNNNAFNSFSRFNVDAGNTVNLIIPNGSERLINIVKNEATNINGILNSVQGGQAGLGNIYLVNPQGIFVGVQGQVNFGALTAVTPTQAFVNNFFNSPGNPNDDAVTALLNGTAPINTAAAISNSGIITGQTKIETQSGSFNNVGTIQLGDIVNVNKIENGLIVGQYNGDVIIKSEGNIANAGNIFVNGKNNLQAGNITLTAKEDLILDSGTFLSDQGIGTNSNGGIINLNGNKNVRFHSGKINAGAKSANSGSINITGDIIRLESNLLTGGADLNIHATTYAGIDYAGIISTRNLQNIYTEDHTTAPSINKSGNINILADNDLVSIRSTNLFAFGSNNFSGGNIILDGNRISELGTILSTDKNVSLNFAEELDIRPNDFVYNGNTLVSMTPSQIYSGGTLSINAKDLNSLSNLNLEASSIKSSALNSNLFVQNHPINITLNPNFQYSFLTLSDLNNFLIGGNPLNPSSITLNATNVKLVGNITTPGDIILNGKLVEFRDTTNLIANNITLNPTQLLSFYSGKITCNNLLTVNGGDITNYGIIFNPTSIDTKTFSSDFLKPGENLVLNSNSGSNIFGQIDLGNIDNVKINNQPITINNITLNSNASINLKGNISIPENIEATSPIIYTSPSTNLNATNINFDASKYLYIFGGNINSSGALSLFSRDILNNGVTLAPNSINATSLNSNFLKQNSPFIINSKASALYFNNFDKIIINGSKLNPTNINITSTHETFSSINLSGEITTPGDININNIAGVVYLNTGADLNNDVKLITAKNINLNANIVTIGGTLTSIIDPNSILLVNANNTIDPSSNIKATIADGNIYVNNSTQQGINITTNHIYGQSGTLKVVTGNQNVNITNNSNNNLILDNINGKSPAAIILNGKKATGNLPTPDGPINVIYQDTGVVNPQVTIANNSAKNILLTGNIINSNGLVTITNTGGNILNLNNIATIYSANTNISANNGTIGSLSQPVNIFTLNNSIFNAQANGVINLFQSVGNMHINQIQSTTDDVYLTSSNGGIIDASPDQTANVIAKNIILNAKNSSSIGTFTDPVDITLNGGVIYAYGHGFINLNSVNSDLNIGMITNNHNGYVKLTSAANITDAFPNSTSPVVISKNLLLDASANGNIGNQNNLLEIDTDDTYSTNSIMALAAGDIYLKEMTGNLFIDAISNIGKGKVYIEANGSIYDANIGPNPDIFAKDIYLRSNLESIGTQQIPINTALNYNTTGGKLYATSLKDININNIGGNMYIDAINASGWGDVNLTSDAGIIDQGKGIWGRNITLNAIKSSSIGLFDTPVKVSLLGGSLTAFGYGFINLTNTHEPNNINNDNIPINIISNAGRGDVVLKSNYDIYSTLINDQPNIYAKNITLTSDNGSIGAADNPLKTYLNYLNTGGVLNATANNGLINISQPVNNLMLNTIEAKDNVILNGTGGIFTNTNLPTINVRGNNITLDSQTQIGTVNNPIVVHPTGTVTANAPKKFIIKQ